MSLPLKQSNSEHSRDPPPLFKSMSQSSSSSSGGIGFCGTLFLIFLVLKLTGGIAWSWWWVTAPLWGGLALGLCFIGLFVALGLLGTGFTKTRRGKY